MRKDLFDELISSVQEAKAIAARNKNASRRFRAEDLLTDEHPDVATLREHFNLSQAKFAVLLGISVDTLQNWEQKRRRPDGPAKVLLRIAALHPDALLSVSQGTTRRRARHSTA